MGEERTKVNRRNDRKNLRQDVTQADLEEGYEEASKLVKLHAEPKTKSACTPHMALPGVTKRAGDRIHQVIGLRMQGFRDVDIAEFIGTAQPEISRLEKNHPDAFAKAEIHALDQAQRKYKINLWGVRAALSDKAPKMIEVLAEIAEDPKMKENVRRQCAVDILNLTGVGHSRQSIGGKDRDLKAGAINIIQTKIDGGADYASNTVIEAEDAEVISE